MIGKLQRWRPRMLRRLRYLILFFALSHIPAASAQGDYQATIQGTVYFDADPWPETLVRLYSRDTFIDTKSGADGKFEFKNLSPGKYDLVVDTMGVRGRIYGLELHDGEHRVFDIKARIEETFYPLDFDCGRTFHLSYSNRAEGKGTALVGDVSAYPGLPLPNALLRTVQITLFPSKLIGREIVLNPDGDGHFESDKVPPGRYTILIQRRGYFRVKSGIWLTRKNTTQVAIILVQHGHPLICE